MSFGIACDSYSPDERSKREGIYAAYVDEVNAHNEKYERGEVTWKRTHRHHLADRTADEVRASRGGSGVDKMHLFHEKRLATSFASSLSPNVDDLPSHVDWRNISGSGRSALTPVKNQGACGSCWAFASVETLESHWFLKTGEMQELSTQFVLDCTPNPHNCGGTGGCGGGTAALAYDRLKQLSGIPSEWTYPYVSGTSKPGGACRGLPLTPEHAHSGEIMRAANVTGRVAVPSNSYADVLRAVATVGPMTVTVDAGAWHDYAGGVFDGGNKTNPDLDHLVQIAGYGSDPALGPYWLVRNSWTPLWGEGGFIRLKRYGADNSSAIPCGVDVSPMDGDGCEGGPARVRVCGTSGILYDAAYPLVL